MYESRKQQPISQSLFINRLLQHLGGAVLLLLISLGIGMWGYMELENLSPADAFLNAAMLLGGMGPVDTPCSLAGKLFAGFYALYAGLVFIISAGLVLTPLAHRLLHKFHWDDKL